MSTRFGTQTSANFEQLLLEVAREALWESKGADWCSGMNCNDRPLGETKLLFTEFMGEAGSPYTLRDEFCNPRKKLTIISLVSIRHPELEDATEDDPNLHYFVDLGGVVLLQTVPYPHGLRTISDEEVGKLAAQLATL